MKTRCATPLALFGAAALFVAAAAPAQALEMCSRPIQPLCSTDMQPATTDLAVTEAERMRCIEDVKRYHEQMMEYRDCVMATVAEAEKSAEIAESMLRCMEERRQDCARDAER
ncbi:MAG: hypothetical protein ACK4QW_01170 [Alphaproteobacteria bacterium]